MQIILYILFPGTTDVIIIIIHKISPQFPPECPQSLYTCHQAEATPLSGPERPSPSLQTWEKKNSNIFPFEQCI